MHPLANEAIPVGRQSLDQLDWHHSCGFEEAGNLRPGAHYRPPNTALLGQPKLIGKMCGGHEWHVFCDTAATQAGKVRCGKAVKQPETRASQRSEIAKPEELPPAIEDKLDLRFRRLFGDENWHRNEVGELGGAIQP
jgi:hypothetical protein